MLFVSGHLLATGIIIAIPSPVYRDIMRKGPLMAIRLDFMPPGMLMEIASKVHTSTVFYSIAGLTTVSGQV